MAHTVKFIDVAVFDAHTDSGDIKRLCEDSYNDVYLPSAINFQGLLTLEGSDQNAEDLTDDQIYHFWLHIFRSYSDGDNVFVDDAENQRKLLARYEDDTLVELKCVTFEGDKVIESNSLVGKDANGSKAWIYSDQAGRPMYDFYKANGANKIVVFTYAGAHAAFILQKVKTYDDISKYVDFQNAKFEDISQTYKSVSGEDVVLDFVKYTVDIKDY